MYTINHDPILWEQFFDGLSGEVVNITNSVRTEILTLECFLLVLISVRNVLFISWISRDLFLTFARLITNLRFGSLRFKNLAHYEGMSLITRKFEFKLGMTFIPGKCWSLHTTLLALPIVTRDFLIYSWIFCSTREFCTLLMSFSLLSRVNAIKNGKANFLWSVSFERS